MLRKCLVMCFVFSVLTGTLRAQALTIDTYSNQLLFNIFKPQPDPVIIDFLKQYAPSLYNKNTIAESTTSKGSDGNQFISEIHSFVFTKHPYFKSSFTTGKLELYCQHFPEPKGVQVYDVKLWFEFDMQQEAEIAYSKLMEIFIPISSNKKNDSMNGFLRGQFSDSNSSKGFNKVQFRLTADNLTHRFKILFETQNEL